MSYPSRRSTRLSGYDYSRPGAYFVTLCIEGRLPLLGHIADGNVLLSPAGEMIAGIWTGLEDHYNGVSMDAFVVMPNHLHGTVVLNEGGQRRSSVPTDSSLKASPSSVSETPANPSLSRLLQAFKSFTTRQYGRGVEKESWPRYSNRLWQHRFHEHIIRNERDLDAIREYIVKNPLQWHLDRENPARKCGNAP